MNAFLFLGCLFFIQTAQAIVLYANPSERVVYFHPTPYLDLSLKEIPDSLSATLLVSMNYGPNAIQKEFNSLMAIYKGYDIKIATAKNTATVFTLDLPTAGVRKDLRLQQTNMGPFIKDKVTLNAIEKFRFSNSKAAIESSIHKMVLRATYPASVEVEKYVAGPVFCSSLDVTQVKDLIFVIGKIEKPETIQYKQTFESLKRSIPENCFELESAEINSFAELMQSKLVLKPNGQAKGSHSEKKSLEQEFEIQPIVYVSEETPEE